MFGYFLYFGIYLAFIPKPFNDVVTLPHGAVVTYSVVTWAHVAWGVVTSPF